MADDLEDEEISDEELQEEMEDLFPDDNEEDSVVVPRISSGSEETSPVEENIYDGPRVLIYGPIPPPLLNEDADDEAEEEDLDEQKESVEGDDADNADENELVEEIPEQPSDDDEKEVIYWVEDRDTSSEGSCNMDFIYAEDIRVGKANRLPVYSFADKTDRFGNPLDERAFRKFYDQMLRMKVHGYGGNDKYLTFVKYVEDIPEQREIYLNGMIRYTMGNLNFKNVVCEQNWYEMTLRQFWILEIFSLRSFFTKLPYLNKVLEEIPFDTFDESELKLMIQCGLDLTMSIAVHDNRHEYCL